jgi:hypothetical protein
MRPLSIACVVTPFFFALAGCLDAPSEDATEVSNLEDDLQLARRSVAILTGDTGRCNTCHTAGKEEIRRWGTTMKRVEDSCLGPSVAMNATQRVTCMQGTNANITASDLGLYAAGVTQPEFENLYRQAYPASEWQSRYDALKRSAKMPAGGQPPLSAADFTTVKTWALRGMPKLDDVLGEPGSIPCNPSTTPELLSHIEEMKTEGWGARLAETATAMAGCGGATSAAACLTGFADITSTFGAPGTRQTLRQMRKLDFRSSYWVRSSPDGRFAAFGGSPSRILDLTTPNASVTVNAPYDPGFFPNNDGFSYAGTQAGGIRVCRTSVLLNALSSHSSITFSEPGCSRVIDTVYQSVGAALDGSLYFMATGAHTNDAGGASGPISASFGASAVTTLTPMFNDGTKYVPGAAVNVTIPHEGDQQMSPSNRLLVTRFGQRAGTAGYRIRRVVPTITPGTGGVGSVRVTMKELGTVCLAGGKPQLSFDERFLAVHQYTDPNANPSGLPTNTSNIFVTDIVTGKIVQVTKVAAGQRALYPHFRADGWLYFLVKDSTGSETLVASDVALRM